METQRLKMGKWDCVCTNKVEDIFEPPPENWGLRGDPFFWSALKAHFQGKNLPYSKEDFTTEFYSFFDSVSGKKLGSEEMTPVNGYAHGGMSSGLLCHFFWQKAGLPLLLSRLKKANKKFK